MYELRKLTPKELESPLAKLANRPVESADLSAFERAMPVCEGYFPEAPQGLVNSTTQRDNGWCISDSGIGYISVKQHIQGATMELLQRMLTWQALEPLNYVVLNPATHHSAAISDVDREKLMIPYLTPDIKCLGYTMFSVEKTPLGLEDVLTLYSSPNDFDIHFGGLYTEKTPVVCGTVIRQSRSEPDPQKKWVGILLHQLSPANDGVDVTTRIWLGCRVLRKKIKNLLAATLKPTPEYVKMLAEQTAQDWFQAARILPELQSTLMGSD